MVRRSFVILLSAILVAPLSAGALAGPTDRRTIEGIRESLLRLPYYGVFDFLAFRYEKGTVTLSGYAYAPRLEEDAVRAVKRVPGVDQVVNEIVRLPVSPNDDRVRWGTFYGIYNDSMLSRYSPTGGVRDVRRFRLTRFPGMQPFGTYPIHIIVRNGRTLLVGAVDFESDKIVAGMRAREVFGAFEVTNELVVPERGTR
jgi:hypothetical protein